MHNHQRTCPSCPNAMGVIKRFRAEKGSLSTLFSCAPEPGNAASSSLQSLSLQHTQIDDSVRNNCFYSNSSSSHSNDNASEASDQSQTESSHEHETKFGHKQKSQGNTDAETTNTADAESHVSEEPIANTQHLLLSNSDCFQVDLQHTLNKHCVGLVLHNEIVTLVKKHSIGRQLNFASNNLKSRAALIERLEKAFNTFSLQPKTIDVELMNGSYATVSVFDWKA